MDKQPGHTRTRRESAAYGWRCKKRAGPRRACSAGRWKRPRRAGVTHGAAWQQPHARSTLQEMRRTGFGIWPPISRRQLAAAPLVGVPPAAGAPSGTPAVFRAMRYCRRRASLAAPGMIWLGRAMTIERVSILGLFICADRAREFERPRPPGDGG
jgi:hypothetical protein